MAELVGDPESDAMEVEALAHEVARQLRRYAELKRLVREFDAKQVWLVTPEARAAWARIVAALREDGDV